MSTVLSVHLLLLCASVPLVRVSHPRPPEVSGELAASEVLKVISSRDGSLRACFEKQALRGEPVEGMLSIAWKILPDGTVANPRAEKLGVNWAATACVLRNLSRFRFPPPRGGAAQVRHTLLVETAQVSRGMDENSLARSVRTIEAFNRPREPCWVNRGFVDLPGVRAVVRRHADEVLACLQTAKSPDAGILGQLSLMTGLRNPAPAAVASWVISAKGVAKDLQCGAGRLPDVERCLTARLLTWKFPASTEEAQITCDLASAVATTVGGSFNCPPGSKPVDASCQLGDGKEGPWKRWTADGSLLEEGSFLGGERTGLWTYWHPRRGGVPPRKWHVETWEKGERHGEWQSWTPEGLPLESGRYEHGLRAGEWRAWHGNGELQSVTEHRELGQVAKVTYFDDLGEKTRSEIWDGGTRQQMTRFAFDEAIAEDAPYPPVCGRLKVTRLSAPGFAAPSRVLFGEPVQGELALIAAVPGDGGTQRLEARIREASSGRWIVASDPPLTRGPIGELTVRPFEGHRLFVWGGGTATPSLLDAQRRAWVAVPSVPDGAEVTLVGRGCAYAWKRVHEQLLLAHGFGWCAGDSSWTALAAPAAFDVADKLSSADGDELFAIAAEPGDGGSTAPRPRRWRAAGYRAASKSWLSVELPGTFSLPVLYPINGGAVLVDSSNNASDARSGIYSAADGGWEPTSIRGTANTWLMPAHQRWSPVGLVRAYGPLVFDEAHRRWAMIPIGAANGPQFLWKDGRLSPLSDTLYTPGPVISILDWTTRRWCEALFDEPSLHPQPQLDGLGREASPRTSAFNLYVGDSALAVWGRRDLFEAPCGAPACSKHAFSSRDADVGVIATWEAPPAPRPR